MGGKARKERSLFKAGAAFVEQEQKSHVAEAQEQNLHGCHDKEGKLLKPEAGLGKCQVHADGNQ